MASAVDSRLAYARPSAVATASRLPTATRGSNNSYTTSWDTTLPGGKVTVTVEIEAEVPEGISDDVRRVISENCRTLHFNSHAFEDS